MLENIAYGLEIRGMSRVERLGKAMEVLELVGLSGWEIIFLVSFQGVCSNELAWLVH